jgi:hypothetical protein
VVHLSTAAVKLKTRQLFKNTLNVCLTSIHLDFRTVRLSPACRAYDIRGTCDVQCQQSLWLRSVSTAQSFKQFPDARVNAGDTANLIVLICFAVGASIGVQSLSISGNIKLAAPDTLFTSSTSWIPASEFSADLPGRGRILVGHPVNPPYLVPLVELSPAPWTSSESVIRARDLYTRAGQSPVVLNKEITGFLLNRIQGAVLNEALNLYAQVYASVADIDTVMKDGLGMRWAFMGPFETIDLNAPAGVVDYARRYSPTYRQVAAQQLPNDWSPELLARVEAERREVLTASQIEERSRWRDNRLMALVAHKQQQTQ